MGQALIPIAIASAIGGGLLAADGAAKQGAAQYQAAMYQAQVAQRNSIIANSNATSALAEGKQAEQNNRDTAVALMGQQRATQAGLGQQLDSGSAGAIIGDTARASETDALTIRQAAQKQALGFSLEAQDATSQGQLDTLQANSAYSSGKIAALGTLLSTAGNVASMQYNYNKYAMTSKTIAPSVGSFAGLNNPFQSYM